MKLHKIVFHAIWGLGLISLLIYIIFGVKDQGVPNPNAFALVFMTYLAYLVLFIATMIFLFFKIRDPFLHKTHRRESIVIIITLIVALIFGAIVSEVIALITGESLSTMTLGDGKVVEGAMIRLANIGIVSSMILILFLLGYTVWFNVRKALKNSNE